MKGNQQTGWWSREQGRFGKGAGDKRRVFIHSFKGDLFIPTLCPALCWPAAGDKTVTKTAQALPSRSSQ